MSNHFSVAPGIWGCKDVFVNFYAAANNDGTWVLIDTALPTSYHVIKRVSAGIFGRDSKPAAILLTHGHFDHTGCVAKLAAEWKVPVYAHYLEFPYLTGHSCYPPPDASVGGGAMASVAWLYPNKPINIESFLYALPDDGTVPGLPGWQYIHTPGHAPGHVSFFRKKDNVLIAADAFVTTIQESLISVIRQTKKLSGPPKYFTYDWDAAKLSVEKLAALRPKIASTGHGKPMGGVELEVALTNLAVHFERDAVPGKGRYVNDPAVTDAGGVLYVPPKEKNYSLHIKIAATALAVAAVTFALIAVKKNKPKWYGR